jgi:hypothetical protein
MSNFLINPFGVCPKQHADPIYKDRECYDFDRSKYTSNISANKSIMFCEKPLENCLIIPMDKALSKAYPNSQVYNNNEVEKTRFGSGILLFYKNNDIPTLVVFREKDGRYNDLGGANYEIPLDIIRSSEKITTIGLNGDIVYTNYLVRTKKLPKQNNITLIPLANLTKMIQNKYTKTTDINNQNITISNRLLIVLQKNIRKIQNYL